VTLSIIAVVIGGLGFLLSLALGVYQFFRDRRKPKIWAYPANVTGDVTKY